ncbi:MAG: carbamoylphosphate synthase large subunit, partial [Lachnospiraceae bacterium]|nr:carbamoylphosphate synthase large subunit [Lachnospiraceae bacterium]
MKNLVFISPNFPTNYWMFCKELKNNGLNVLGIGDQPYDEMTQDQRDSLTEYYKVDSLEDRDAVYRAVAFFIHKYGRIDWLESNNEYWLEGDAQLRTAYNITSGFQAEDMNRIKYKSRMKESYIRAGIPVARYHLADKVEGGLAFAQEVGYPIVAKPDNGVGASHTFKINNDDEMRAFYDAKWTDTQYIMEEFIHGEINSYDAIIDSHGEPLFETGNVTPSNLMEVVNNMDNSIYYIQKDLPDDVRKAGRATVKSFGVKSRFVHFEFFRLLSDHSHLGKKGDVVALEVNMRPCGGFTPDMINFAYSTNVYKIWADMIAFDHSTVEVGQHEFCAYAGLRDGKNFVMTHSDIMDKYGYCMRMVDRIPDALAGAMANK